MGRTPLSRPLPLLGATTLAAVVLCGCRAGTEPNLADIGGSWQYTETFTDVSHAITCADSGTYSLSQAGASFVRLYFQRGLCRTPTGLTDNTESGTVSEGRVVGRPLRFRAEFCTDDGVMGAVAGT